MTPGSPAPTASDTSPSWPCPSPAATRWLQLNVSLASRDGSRRPAERALLARLDAARPRLRDLGAPLLWFVRKPPDLRVRLGGAPGAAALRLAEGCLAAARDAGEVLEWFPSAYEPETFNFGGPAATEAVHRHFDADARLYVERQRLLAAGAARLSAPVLCLAVLADLFERCTGDRAEAWDVWCNLGPTYAGVEAPALDLPPVSLARLRPLVGPGEAALLDGYAAAAAALAADLDALWRRGALLWGRRAILPALAPFLWNRHAVPAPTIAGTVRAMIDALSPKTGMIGAHPDPAP